MSHNLPFQVQSFLILGLIFVGVYFRRNRSKHIKIMGTAMVWDILLILQIELVRNAIAKAAKGMLNPVMLNIHVGLAVTTVILYGFMVFSGRAVLAGKPVRSLHKKLGITTLILRTLVVVTSFYTQS